MKTLKKLREDVAATSVANVQGLTTDPIGIANPIPIKKKLKSLKDFTSKQNKEVV